MSREKDILSLSGLIYKFLHKKNLYVTDDLVQCCWEYAINAVDTHNPAKGALSTHVSWALMAAMKHFFCYENRHEGEEYIDEITQDTPRPDKSVELSELLANISDSRGEKCLRLRISGYSIEEISTITKETVSNVRFFLRKTRQELRELNGLE